MSLFFIVSSLWFCMQMYMSMPHNNNNNNKKAYQIVNFTVSANHKIKLKEGKKRDRYLDLARELKKLWNRKVTIIPIIIGALGTVTKWLVKGLEDSDIRRWIESIQTTAPLRSARILRKVLETWGDLLSLRFQWKTIS